MTAPSGGRAPRLSALAIAAYAAPGVPEAMLLYCASMIIPGFYSTEMGLRPEVIGMVMVVGRVFDAVIDPVIGYLADVSARKLGSRKPWLVAGAVVSSIAVAFLYAPPAGVSATYYLGWTLCLYVGWTLAIIPYDAWGADISRDYLQRAKIFGYRSFAYYFGSLLFLCTPFLWPDEAGFGAHVLRRNAWMVAALFAVTVPIALLFGPRGHVSTSRRAIGFFASLAGVRHNRPMLRFLGVFCINGLGLGISLALSMIYVTSYLHLAPKFPVILLGYSIATMVAVPLWMRVIARLGKHRAWAIAMVADAVLYLGLAPLPPGPASYLPVLGLIILTGVVDSVGRVAADSILGDIIDYDQMKTGHHRAANYYAIKSLVYKANVAVGGGLAFLALDWFGFDPQAADHDRVSAFGLVLLIWIVPAVLNVAAGALLWRFPLDRRRQDVIRRRLESLARARLPA